MDINMTLLLALSVLLASPCHLAAPEFFVFVTLGPAWGAEGEY
jgi:hypothetical protein